MHRSSAFALPCKTLERLNFWTVQQASNNSRTVMWGSRGGKKAPFLFLCAGDSCGVLINEISEEGFFFFQFMHKPLPALMDEQTGVAKGEGHSGFTRRAYGCNSGIHSNAFQRLVSLNMWPNLKHLIAYLLTLIFGAHWFVQRRSLICPSLSLFICNRVTNHSIYSLS